MKKNEKPSDDIKPKVDDRYKSPQQNVQPGVLEGPKPYGNDYWEDELKMGKVTEYEVPVSLK